MKEKEQNSNNQLTISFTTLLSEYNFKKECELCYINKKNAKFHKKV